MGGARSGRTGALWLAAAGAASILAIHAVLAFLLSQSVTAKLLAREGQLKQEFLNSILAAEPAPETLFAAPGPSPTLVSFGSRVRDLPGVMRVNIYSPDGYIRHSTEPNLVGVHFSDNDELAESFEGKITSSLETVERNDKSEHLALNQLGGEELIEAYIPVIGKDGKVAAVVEFYRRDDWVRDLITNIKRHIWLGAALSSLILAGVMLLAFRMLRKAD